jgi:hypothetical protein
MVLAAGGMRGFFLRQPRELEEAAALDGCSAFDTFTSSWRRLRAGSTTRGGVVRPAGQQRWLVTVPRLPAIVH